MIKLEMLRCFVTVARSGNLADAGGKLGRTPSAVSMMLKQLEDRLGQPLFESDRKSRLTALGEFTLGEASHLIEQFEHSVSAIERFSRSESGYVRVAAVPSVAEAVLPDAVRTFLRAFPDVRIDVQDMDSVAVMHELARERVDLCIATDLGTSAEIEGSPLFSDAFGVVCHPSHPLAARKDPLRWRELHTWPFIANGICQNIEDEVFQDVLREAHLMVRNTTSLLAMVRAEVGITVLPALVVEQNKRGLKFLKVADPAARRNIDLLTRARRTMSPAAQSFVEVVRQIVASKAFGM